MKLNSILLLTVPLVSMGLMASEPSPCGQIISDSERLKCYDKIYRPQIDANAPIQRHTVTESAGNERQQGVKAPKRKRRLAPYRPNYFLLYSYNSNRDTTLYPVTDLSFELDRPEAKFQISFKGPVLLDILDSDIDLWFGYTQLSFWQWFNTDLSSPFRESNYEPEAWFEKGLDFEIALGWTITKIAAGFNHQSNGQEELLSRSWNRLLGGIDIEKSFDNGGKFLLNVKTWHRISEDFDDDDNPDITRFMGHNELTAIYHQGEHEVSLIVRNIANSRRGVNLNWSFPIVGSDHFKGYLQYFNGYGESLIDYNHFNQSIGFGFTISDWM